MKVRFKLTRLDLLRFFLVLAMALASLLAVSPTPVGAAVTTTTGVLAVPNTAGSVASYTIGFSTSGASSGLTEDIGTISITFPAGTGIPGYTGYIPASLVFVNNNSCSSTGINGVVPPAPAVSGQTVIIYTPVVIAAGVRAMTVTFAQAAGITNPAIGSTTLLVRVATSDPADNVATALAAYTVTPVISISPTYGPRGTVVAVTGRGFATSRSVDISLAGVNIGSTSSDAYGNISATVTIPSTAVTGAVVGTDGAGTASPAVTFTVTPSVALTPSAGLPGTTVQLTGSAFTANCPITASVGGTGVAVVGAIGGLHTTGTGAIFSIAGGAANNITIVIPQNATAGVKTVTVTDAAGVSASATFEVTARTFTVTPASGNVGTLVTLTGTGLTGGGTIAANSITFGGVAATHGAVTIATDGSWSVINVPVPDTVATGSVTVAVTDGNRPASGTFIVASRSITIVPSSVVAGGQIVVSGSGFKRNGTVNVQEPVGTNRATATADAAGSFAAAISATWLAGAAGTQTMTVTAVDSVAANIVARATFTIPGAAITVNPASAPVGSSVTVSGTGFTPYTTLTALTIGVIAVLPPAGVITDASGNFSVTVMVPGTVAIGGTTITVTQGAIVEIATFIVPAASLSVSPVGGPPGITVTVTGTGFPPFSALAVLTLGAVNVLPPSVTTNGFGRFDANFVVPGLALGPAVLAASVGTTTATTSFTVSTSIIPGHPCTFYGNVTLNGAAAANGTPVSAVIDGVEVASTVTTGSSYVLPVPEAATGTNEGKAVSFRIAGKPAAETGVWSKDSVVRLDLSVYYLSVSLAGKWNFISTPRKLAPGKRTVAEVFGGVNTAGHSIWLYDDGTWTAMQAGDIIKPLDGIWVYSASPGATVDIGFDSNPLVTPPTKQLEAGWNAIGFSDTVLASANSALTSVEREWAYLIGFDAATQRYLPSIINNDEDGGSHDEDNPMLPTQGYWLYMTSPKELAGISAGAGLAAQEVTGSMAEVSAASVPMLPAEFLGTVTLNGKDAPAGTQIVATIDGTEVGSLVTTEAGIFGQSGIFGNRLAVTGSQDDMGRIITFYVNGSRAQTTSYQPGESGALDLSVKAHPLFGDVGGDNRVDLLDLVAVAAAFNSHWREAVWNEYADFNKDGRIDIFDLALVGMNFGKGSQGG